MRVWVEVYDAAGTRLGIVENVKSAEVVRRLDGVGSVRVTMPGTDRDALELMQMERRIRVYIHQNNQTREVGRGIIRKPGRSDNASGRTFTVDCPDELTEFKDKSTLLGRIYGESASTTLTAVVSDLVGLVDGWSANVEASALGKQISARFDGVTVLKALQYLAESYGLHLRQSVGGKRLEFGAFGTDINLTLRNVEHTDISLQDNDDVALIESISVDEDAENVVNRIYPQGGGVGLASFDLAQSTRTGADGYAIQSETGPDGRTLYYLETGERPVREAVRKYKITPLANSPAAKTVAANALYDACANDLDRSSQTQKSYSISLSKVRKTVRAGDKVTLKYLGVVKDDKGYYTYRNEDGEFWVLEVRESFNLSGVRTSLTISNVDRQPETIAERLVGGLSEMQTRAFEVVTFPYQFNDSWIDTVKSGVGLSVPKLAKFKLPIEDIVTDVFRVIARFTTYPQMAGTGISNGVSLSDGHVYTFSSYFTQDSDYYPHEVGIIINGVDRTSALGGPWGVYTASISVQVDITEYIVNDSGGLYQQHDIEFYCANQGVPVNIAVPTAAGVPAGYSTVVGLPSQQSAESRGRILLSVSLLGSAQAIKTS